MIIVLEDDHKVSAEIAEILKDQKLEIFSNVDAFITASEALSPKLAILDFDFAGIDGLEVFKRMRGSNPYLKTIMLSSSLNIPLSVTAAKLGVSAFLRKPLELGNFKKEIDRLINEEEQEILVLDREGYEWLLGTSSKAAEFLSSLEAAAFNKKDVLIIGEQGIDFKGIANLIHSSGPNKGKKFIEINLSSFGKETAESSLFLTLQELLLFPALSNVKEANDQVGTIYFEGISEIAEHLRRQLVLFIQKRRKDQRVSQEIRIIFSSFTLLNDIEDSIIVSCPPLRERKEDLPVILEALLASSKNEEQKISSPLLKTLMFYDFPGNYEELKIFSKSQPLDLKGLPMDFRMFLNSKLNELLNDRVYELDEVRRDFEREFLTVVLGYLDHDYFSASRILDLPKTVLMERLKELGLEEKTA